jgi:hypothetical protein
MDNIVEKVRQGLEDDKVYKLHELTRDRFPDMFPFSQETIERWCREGVFPGAFKFKDADRSEWLITGRDFKLYFKQQMNLFV